MILDIVVNTSILYTFDKESTYDAYAYGYSTPLILVHENTFPLKDAGKLEPKRIRQYSNLSIYEDQGPRFSINDSIDPTMLRGPRHVYYEVTYGTYYLNIPKMYACTLLNKGYEDAITFVGDADKCVEENAQDLFLAPGSVSDGDYSFYYGKVAITVKKSFSIALTLYSLSFGYMSGVGILRFVEPFSPVDSQVISLPLVNTLHNRDILRFNQDTAYSLYGLSMGIYTVSLGLIRVSFLNQGCEDLFSVKGDGIEGVSPTGASCIYYQGVVQIHVKGNFDNLSMCTSSTQYSGGYKRLVYHSFYGAPSYVGVSLLPKRLYSQNTLNFLDQGITFNQDDTYDLPRYRIGIGTYRIFHLHPYPITLLNQGKESMIYIVSLQPACIVRGLGPDGLPTLFYYGVFDLVVKGDFNNLSIYSREMNQGLGKSVPLFTYGN
jgi:hypothetical protein